MSVPSRSMHPCAPLRPRSRLRTTLHCDSTGWTSSRYVQPLFLPAPPRCHLLSLVLVAFWLHRTNIIIPLVPPGKARILFTRSSTRAPSELVKSLPQRCMGTECEEPDCGYFDIENSMTLHDNSPIVRESKYDTRQRVRCNMWSCTVELDDGSESRPGVGSEKKVKSLMRCAKCKEVFYCSAEHQVRLDRFSRKVGSQSVLIGVLSKLRDWPLHKTLCETR